jgi:glycosyltransferase involved in cell wall biosynthesis
MKIILYNSSLAYGGAERVTVYLAEYFSNNNIDTMIVTNNIADQEYQVQNNVKHKSLFNKHEKRSNVNTIKKLRKLLKKEQPDVLLVMGTPLIMYAIPAAMGLKTKVIVSERNSPQNFAGKKSTKIISNWLFTFADGYVFQTHDAASYYSKIKGNKKIIPNPLFTKDLPEPYEGERKKEVVNVGRLNKQKNQEMLIRAFSKIADKYHEYQLIIYGEGPERNNLEKIIKELNLVNRVMMPGAFSNVLEKIKTSSLFAFSSDFEGMPNALIEAMALGLPVISTDCPCGGPRELIDDGINGLLVPVGDIDTFVNKMDYILSNKERAGLMASKAVNIREKLDSQNIGRQWLDFCLEVINNEMDERKVQMPNKILQVLKEPKYAFQYLIHRGNFKSMSDEKYLRMMFKHMVGHELNLENPKTFNEKLQWLKLYDRNPLYTQLVDKYEARKYVAKSIGEEYLIPLIGIWDEFDDIDFSKLPNQFILKCTHDSGGIVICKDKNKLNIEVAKNKINKSLKRNYYYLGREWPYKNVKPRIICEKYMVDESGIELKDYKFFCFGGSPKILFVATDRGVDTRFDFYDMKFTHIPVMQHYKNGVKKIIKPKGFTKMVKLASQLSKDIPHVRIDFYDVNGKVYFGELTFYHFSGFEKFDPEEYDDIFGNWIELPLKIKK